MRIIKGVLLSFIIAAGTFGAPTIAINHPFPSMQLRLARSKAQIQPYQMGLAKTTALVWEQVGSTHFANTAGLGNPVTWRWISRDTIVYDADGNQILFKTSTATTGWAADSLESLDSSVYTGGRIAERFSMSFMNYNNTLTVSGYHDTMAWLNGGKTCVGTYYDWNDAKKHWVANSKDSIVFSAPVVAGGSGYIDMRYLAGEYSYSFDTVGSSWKDAGHFARIDSETTATKLTLVGKELLNSLNGAADSLIDTKFIFTFNSSVWTGNNMIQQVEQRKNPSTGTYYDFGKYTYSVDAHGYQTSTEYFSWDSTTKSLVCMFKDMHFPDSHGNDTLAFQCNYATPTQTWDTSSIYGYARSYDNIGNNIVTVESFYDPPYASWGISTKDVNTFAQINSAVIRLVKPAAKQGNSVVTTATRVIVTAPNITGLMLYNAAGRMVSSVKQKAAGSISLELSSSSVPISSGIYIAKLMHGNEQSSLRLPIQR
jgi:hypothetical protein